MSDASGAILTLDEAVLLGHALVDSVARDLGVRALAIKGPALSAQGLRPASGSVDVDFLIDPVDFARLKARLGELGWVDVEPHELPTVMPRHSSTLRHVIWPCEIDLHHYFPGFLAEPQVVFDCLWDRHVQVEIARAQVSCPAKECHVLLAALHYLRDSKTESSRQRLAGMVEILRTWPSEQLDGLVDIAVATGAEATVSPLFAALDLARPEPMDRPGLDEWRLRSESETTAALAWWVDLRRARWWQKPGRLRRAVWPSTSDMNLFLGTQLPEGAELNSARRARLRRGLSQLPRAIRESRGRVGRTRSER